MSINYNNNEGLESKHIRNLQR